MAEGLGGECLGFGCEVTGLEGFEFAVDES